MTPNEKAEKLLKKMLGKNPNRQDGISRIDVIQAKQCALIAVDEIMYNNLMEYPQHSMIYAPHKNDYWNEVKQEIEKL